MSKHIPDVEGQSAYVVHVEHSMRFCCQFCGNTLSSGNYLIIFYDENDQPIAANCRKVKCSCGKTNDSVPSIFNTIESAEKQKKGCFKAAKASGIQWKYFWTTAICLMERN